MWLSKKYLNTIDKHPNSAYVEGNSITIKKHIDF